MDVVARKACKEKCRPRQTDRQRDAEGQGRQDRETERKREREARTSPGIRRRRRRQGEMELLMDDHATQGARGLGCSSSSSRSWMAPLGAPLRCVRNSQGRKNVSRAAAARQRRAGDLTAQRRVQQPAAAGRSSSSSLPSTVALGQQHAKGGETAISRADDSNLDDDGDKFCAAGSDSARIAAGVQHREPWNAQRRRTRRQSLSQAT